MVFMLTRRVLQYICRLPKAMYSRKDDRILAFEMTLLASVAICGNQAFTMPPRPVQSIYAINFSPDRSIIYNLPRC